MARGRARRGRVLAEMRDKVRLPRRAAIIQLRASGREGRIPVQRRRTTGVAQQVAVLVSSGESKTHRVVAPGGWGPPPCIEVCPPSLPRRPPRCSRPTARCFSASSSRCRRSPPNSTCTKGGRARPRAPRRPRPRREVSGSRPCDARPRPPMALCLHPPCPSPCHSC